MKKKISIFKTINLVGLVPLLLIAAVICSVSIKKLNESLEDSTFTRLKVAAEGLDMYYSKEIIENGEATYEHDYVDNLKEQNIEQTLFIGDTRFVTSIIDKNTNERNEGTKAEERIYQQVMSGKDFQDKGVVIGGKKYYVYYAPVKNAQEEIVGMAFAGEPVASIEKELKSTMIRMIIITLGSAIVLSGLVVFVADLIKKPIVKIAKSTDEFSKGNLENEITITSRVREIALLIESICGLRDNLVNIISKVDTNVDTMNKDMGEITEGVHICNQAFDNITSAVTEVTNGSVDMANSVQTCTTSMHNIGDEITQITDLANSANNNAGEVLAVSENAKTQLSELIAANGNTSSVSKDVIQGINEANLAAEKIRTAASTITEISAQTNLLSLNASIEAARAGEAGAGFAVVAGSIQNLANQSNQSAKEIQDVIQNILSISENNVKLANNIKQAVDQEDSVLSEVNSSFDVVNNKVKDTADAVSSIHDKALILDKTKNTVLDEVMALSAISEENAASCEETSASIQEVKANIATIHEQSEDTKSVSAQLVEAVSYFKL